MTDLFIEILNMSFTASYIALIVMAIRMIMKKTPKKYSYALWAVVFFRLVCPFTIQLPVSAVPVQPQTIPHDIVYSQSPYIQSGILAIDNTINAAIEKAILPIAPANNVKPIQIVITIAMFFWLTGVIALLLYGIISYLRLAKRVSTAICVHNNIYETDLIKTPFVLGFIYPKIYMPIGLGEKEFEYVIKHEQTHIKRFDYLIKPLAFFISSVHWFNPIVWVSYAFMTRDMELSADENVMKCSVLDIRQDYSSSLLALSIKKSGLLSPLAFGETGVKERIKNVLKYKKPAFWVSLTAVAIVIIASISLAASVIVSKPKDESIIGENASWNYGDFDDFPGFSNLLVFPESLSTSALIEDYYCEWSNGLFDFFDPTCQIYLECAYDETDFYEEIERLSQIQVTYNDEVNKIRFEESRFNFPAYIAIDADNYCYEYALLLEEEYKIIYIFSQFIQRDEVTFNHEYLPDDYMEIENPQNFSIYLFDVGRGVRHGVY